MRSTAPLLLCCLTAPASALLLLPGHHPRLSRRRPKAIFASASEAALRRASTLDASGESTATASAGLQLFTSYDATVELLLEEIGACDAGDHIFLQLYLLEGGSSSEAILAALEEAGSSRGASVTFVLDVSYVSEISRLIERTDTLIPRVAALAERHAWCDVAYRSKPDHAKYALFLAKQ